ncbi:DUF294 nucleotidyltransferase-like domain-containing protein [Rhodobacteraceae bacterium XHP0102]|nr:DUF294 nucleotidyltransferase-like domain-containing protein [Rhodobacteraceae bacterium XHP0102]
MPKEIWTILSQTHPYDSLPPELLTELSQQITRSMAAAGAVIYRAGAPLEALYLIVSGQVDITEPNGDLVSILGPKNSFGERGLMRDGIAPVTATAAKPTELLEISAPLFHRLVKDHPTFLDFFDRTRPARARRSALSTQTLGDLMTRNPLTCRADDSLLSAAQSMRDHRISCLLVTTAAGELQGIVTTRDLTNRALAEGLSSAHKVAEIMTPDPKTLPATALVADALHLMVEHGFTHMPIMDRGKLEGILSQTDMMRFQATSSASIIMDISQAPNSAAIAQYVKGIPALLMQLVGAHNDHQVVTRLITDIGDAATRRLLKLAEDHLGPPPVPYLWLACGSQGRQEQTGVSDQDNCLIIDDAMRPEDDAYFAALAKFVSDGLDEAGYFYCPGDMMATAQRWRQPLRVWRSYFSKWINKPDNEAQMLASVMFDLRPIGGAFELFADLHRSTLSAASENSIFVAHMISNSLKHTPPLGLFRGFATVRSGEHKDRIDLKHNGVVPVVDLGRIYALKGQLTEVNTRARLEAAIETGTVSQSGGRDLLDAYDMIAEARLAHQARQIRNGKAPDNFMSPAYLSDFDRSHLRDAFVVIKTMQSAIGQRSGFL